MQATALVAHERRQRYGQHYALLLGLAARGVAPWRTGTRLRRRSTPPKVRRARTVVRALQPDGSNIELLEDQSSGKFVDVV